MKRKMNRMYLKKKKILETNTNIPERDLDGG